MANGKQHAAASLLAAIPTGLIAGVIAGDPLLGASATAGCIAGVFVTPDLDQPTISKSESFIVRHIPVVGWQWLALWDLYSRIIPHRHILSHLPILGTAIRRMYIALWSCLIKAIQGMSIALPNGRVLTVEIGSFIGLTVSDSLHWIMDGCPVYLKNYYND